LHQGASTTIGFLTVFQERKETLGCQEIPDMSAIGSSLLVLII